MGTPESKGEKSPGDERRAALIGPGEEFLGNWDNGAGELDTRFGQRTVYQQMTVYEASGNYHGIRTITAYSQSGNELPSMKGIVAQQSPQTVLAALVPRPRRPVK